MRTPLVLAAVALAACGIFRFSFDTPLAEQRIAGNPLGGVLPAELLPNPIQLPIDIQAETQKRNTGPATAVLVTALSFSATQASGNFDFLSEIRLTIEAPGLAAQEIGTLIPVPKGATTIKLNLVPELNLLPYIKAGATLKASAKGTLPSRDFTFDGKVTLEVRI